MRGVRLWTAAVVVVTAGAALSTPPATAAEEPEPVVGLVVTRTSGTTAREAQALVAAGGR
jgi:ABC-type sugar transport system substrate-binding protein